MLLPPLELPMKKDPSIPRDDKAAGFGFGLLSFLCKHQITWLLFLPYLLFLDFFAKKNAAPVKPFLSFHLSLSS